MLKHVVIYLMIVACAGCSTIMSAEMQVAQKLLDAEIQGAEDIICKYITISSWQRRYGTSAEKADGWSKLCSVNNIAPKVLP